MALVVTDFIQPQGRLRPVWFDDIEACVAGYLEEAIEKTTSITDADDAEAAQVAWVYYRAYSLIYEESLISPAEQRTQETWDRWTEGQIKELGRLAGNYQQEFFRTFNRGVLGQDFIPVVPGYAKKKEAAVVNESPYPL